MGSEDGNKASKERSLAAVAAAAASTGTAWGTVWNIMLLGTMVATNMLALYSLSISRDVQRTLASSADTPTSATLSILQELASIREELRRTQRHLLRNGAEKTQVIDSRSGDDSPRGSSRGGHGQEEDDDHQVGFLASSELVEFTAERMLPLGRNPNYGLESMVSPIGHQCYSHKELLEKYMNYSVGELCPDDWSLGQALMVRGCEPLPRRRCFARTPASHSAPYPLPDSLWSSPPDDLVLWTHYTCKSFECLQNRAKDSTVFYDCADCFDLMGPERNRWVSSRDRHDFMSLDEILMLKQGSIRVGLDLGGGAGSFAARMLRHNVTIITSTLNLNGPFNEFVALRGLVPLYITVSQRLPFFDNTLDIVHTMHVLSNWLPLESLEFILYDIDRVLRPKGLFWLDHFFCTENQLEGMYVPMIERLGYKKVKWVIGKKLDKNGILNREVYLSALLEKPVRG